MQQTPNPFAHEPAFVPPTAEHSAEVKHVPFLVPPLQGPFTKRTIWKGDTAKKERNRRGGKMTSERWMQAVAAAEAIIIAPGVAIAATAEAIIIATAVAVAATIKSSNSSSNIKNNSTKRIAAATTPTTATAPKE